VLCTSSFIIGVTTLPWVKNVKQKKHIVKEIFSFKFREIFCSGLYSAKKGPLQWDKDSTCSSVLVPFLKKVTEIKYRPILLEAYIFYVRRSSFGLLRFNGTENQ
jgi:hypothetical protein